MPDKKSRKEQILDAVLDVLHSNPRWSLSDIAEKIGISKTAIYRHFKNRAEIETELNNRLAGRMLEVIEATEFTPPAMRAAMTAFFQANSGFVHLIMNNSFIIPEYEHVLYKNLESTSPKLAAFTRSLAERKPDEQTDISAAFLKNCVTILIGSLKMQGIEFIQTEMLRTLATGFPTLPKPSGKRLDELESISAIAGDELNTGTKLFDAIAAAVKEQGIAHATIDRIAEKMGTAKSSLYFYFRNKGEMLHEMIKKENDTIIALCAARASRGKTIAEQLYIIMMVQANYLLHKPDLIPVFNWIRYESVGQGREAPPHGNIDIESMTQTYRLSELFPEAPDRNRPVAADTAARGAAVLKWAAILSTSAIIQGQRLGGDADTIRKQIRSMYKSMLNGDR